MSTMPSRTEATMIFSKCLKNISFIFSTVGFFQGKMKILSYFYIYKLIYKNS